MGKVIDGPRKVVTVTFPLTQQIHIPQQGRLGWMTERSSYD